MFGKSRMKILLLVFSAPKILKKSGVFFREIYLKGLMGINKGY